MLPANAAFLAITAAFFRLNCSNFLLPASRFVPDTEPCKDGARAGDDVVLVIHDAVDPATVIEP